MSTWLLVGIIVFVIGFILSNIMLLKKSANHSFSSSLSEANQKHQDKIDDQRSTKDESVEQAQDKD